MDLQVVSTQHNFYRVDVDTLCQILLELFPENLKRLHDLPVPPKPVKYSQVVEVATEPQAKLETRKAGKREATFSLGRNKEGVLVLVCRCGSEVYEYLNPPAGAKQVFERAGFELPEEALKDYELAYKNEHRAVSSRPANVRRV